MSVSLVNPKNLVLTVNGRQLTQLGTDTPFQRSPVDPKRGLVIAMGGDEVVTVAAGQKMQYTIGLLQHSADSKFLFNLYKSNKNHIVNFSYYIIGTDEKASSTSAVMTTLGDINRGIMDPSDDIFIFEVAEKEHDMGNMQVSLDVRLNVFDSVIGI